MAIHDDIDTPLAKACRKAGSQSALARIVGRDQSTIHELLRDGKEVPAEYVLPIERELRVSRHDLRLDLYPREGCHAEQCPEHGRPNASNPREDSPRVPPADTDAPSAGGSASRDALQGVRA